MTIGPCDFQTQKMSQKTDPCVDASFGSKCRVKGFWVDRSSRYPIPSALAFPLVSPFHLYQNPSFLSFLLLSSFLRSAHSCLPVLISIPFPLLPISLNFLILLFPSLLILCTFTLPFSLHAVTDYPLPPHSTFPFLPSQFPSPSILISLPFTSNHSLLTSPFPFQPPPHTATLHPLPYFLLCILVHFPPVF
jgi:hypothetical protein